MDVDGALAPAVDLLPHLGQDLALGHDLTDAAREQEQQVELPAGQLDRDAVDRHLARGRVHDEAADDEPVLTLRRGRATEHGPHPGLELVDGEGLEDVVVGPGVQGTDDGRVVVTGRHDDDRGVPHRAQHRQDGVAVEVGQAEVEQHQLGPVVHRVLESVEAAVGARHGVTPVPEGPDEGGADGRVVLDDEHVCHSENGTPGGVRADRPRTERRPVLSTGRGAPR